MSIKLEDYTMTHHVKAVRITSQNREELLNTHDLGDGAVNIADDGDWLVIGLDTLGTQIVSNRVFKNAYVKKRKSKTQ